MRECQRVVDVHWSHVTSQPKTTKAAPRFSASWRCCQLPLSLAAARQLILDNNNITRDQNYNFRRVLKAVKLKVRLQDTNKHSSIMSASGSKLTYLLHS